MSLFGILGKKKDSFEISQTLILNQPVFGPLQTIFDFLSFRDISRNACRVCKAFHRAGDHSIRSRTYSLDEIDDIFNHKPAQPVLLKLIAIDNFPLEAGNHKFMKYCFSNDLAIPFTALIGERSRLKINDVMYHLDIMEGDDILCYCVIHNKVRIFRKLLDEGYDPTKMKNSLMIYVCETGALVFLEILLNDKRINPACNGNEPIVTATENGKSRCVEILLKRKEVDPNPALMISVKMCQIKIFKILLEDERTDPTLKNNELLVEICKLGDKELFNILIKNSKLEYNENNNNALMECIAEDFHEIVKTLLCKKLVDPNYHNVPLFMCCFLGRTKIFKALLSTKRVDPSVNDQMALKACVGIETELPGETLIETDEFDLDKNAILHDINNDEDVRKGRFAIMKILLSDNRVDPTIDNNIVLQKAIESDYTEFAKRLLSKKSVVPAKVHLQECINRGNIEIFKKIANKKVVDPSTIENILSILLEKKFPEDIFISVFRHKNMQKQIEKVGKKLLETCINMHLPNIFRIVAEKVCISDDNGKLFLRSIEEDDYEIFTMFLEEKEIMDKYVAFENNLPLRLAARNGCYAIVKHLLTLHLNGDKRIDPKVNVYEIIRTSYSANLDLCRFIINFEKNILGKNYNSSGLLESVRVNKRNIVLQEEIIRSTEEQIKKLTNECKLHIQKGDKTRATLILRRVKNFRTRLVKTKRQLDAFQTTQKKYLLLFQKMKEKRMEEMNQKNK